MKLCPKHPKYRGKKQPTNDCLGCLIIWGFLGVKPRVQHKPTKVVKSKKTYTRKRKHKNGNSKHD